MTTVRYEAKTHRLRIEGPCRDDDRATVHDALETFAKVAHGHLTVDLTAVTGLADSVADDLVEAARQAGTSNTRLTFVRKHGTSVDEAIVAAQDRGRRPAG